jgi:hypothetical protein
VLEAVFFLLEFPSPSRRIFIGSHSLPPLSGSPYQSFTFNRTRLLKLCRVSIFKAFKAFKRFTLYTPQ